MHETFRSYSDNRSYVRKIGYPQIKSGNSYCFCSKGRLFKMYFRNAITIKISYFFKQNGHNGHHKLHYDVIHLLY